MSLIQGLRERARDRNSDLTELLQKTEHLAWSQGETEVEFWAHQELEGYRWKNELPDYRVLRVVSFADFVNSEGETTRNVPISPAEIPGTLIELVTIEHVMAAIQSLIQTVESVGSPAIRSIWPPTAVVELQESTFPNLKCERAWRSVPVSALKSILERVRTRVLDFALKSEP